MVPAYIAQQLFFVYPCYKLHYFNVAPE